MNTPTDTDTVTQEVLGLEREFWQAERSFHDAHYAEGIITVIDGRILDRDEAVTSIGPVPPLADLNLEDLQVRRLADDTVAVAYRAAAQREGRDGTYAALVGSVYVNRDGCWQLAFHQHTPVPGR